MATFQYSIITKEGISSKGTFNAKNKKAAIQTFESEGAQVVSITEIKSKKKGKQLLLGRKVLKGKKLTAFTRQLASLIEAGIPVVRSLRTLQKQLDKVNPLGAFVIKSVADDVEGGEYFSEALARQKSSFSQFYVSMVEAAEASGAMDIILNRLAIFMERSEKIRRRIISAMTYPSIILLVAIAITYGLMVVIVPKIVTMFDDMTEGKEELPQLTQIVVAVSKFLQEHFLFLLLVLGGAFVGFKLLLKVPIIRNIIDLIRFYIPVAGKIYKKVVLARLSRNLSLLLDTGVPILTSLGIADRSCNNAVVSGILLQVNSRVQDGEGIGKIFGDFGFFPTMMVSMVEVGEESGRIPDMLDKVADLYESEVETTIDSLSSIIEPIMMVMLALIIGTIVIAMFLPMIALLQSLGQ